MQQRLQIARCLAQDPVALLMDEPFGALDAMTRQGLQDEVLSLVAASGATVLFVTHDLEEAIYLGDRVIGLLPHPGRIGIEVKVDLPRPRDQLTTREHPEFLRLAPRAVRLHQDDRGQALISSETWKGLALPAVLIVAGEIAGRMANLTDIDSLAPPSAIVVAFFSAVADGSIITTTRDTLATAFTGLAVGGAIGLLIGIILGVLPTADRLMEVTIESIRPIPSIAILPIALIALGFGYRLEIAIVSFACMWPLLILTRAAVRGVEPRLMEVSRALRLTPGARITKIVIPAALPRIFVAFRLAAGIALIVSVTVEIAINPLGLGHAIMTAQQALRPELMLAYLVWLGIVGWGLNALLVVAQQRLFGRAAMVEEPR